MTDAELSKWEAELRRHGIDAVRPDAADVLLLIANIRDLQAACKALDMGRCSICGESPCRPTIEEPSDAD